jgi:hypothetical protein
MKHRTVLITAGIFCLIRSPALEGQPQQEQSPPSIESRWVAKILQVTRPDSVTIRKFKEVEIPPPDERNESPSENQQWFVLRVELKAPPKSVVETEEINIVDEESAAYAAMGRDCCGYDAFVLFKELPLGLAIGRDPEAAVLYLEPDTGKTGIRGALGSLISIQYPGRNQVRASSGREGCESSGAASIGQRLKLTPPTTERHGGG